MANGISRITLDHLITAALTHKPYNQQRLGTEAERYSLRLSRAKAPDLPDDLHDDICQQAFVELFKLSPSALTKRTGKVLFRRAVLAAIRAVRASYAPPGQRTRAGTVLAVAKVAAEDIGRVADAKTVEANTKAEGDFGHIDFDKFEDERQVTELHRVEHSIDAESILKRAPEDVERALRLIYLDGEPVAAAAMAMAQSRFALSRRISAFYTDWRAAA